MAAEAMVYWVSLNPMNSSHGITPENKKMLPEKSQAAFFILNNLVNGVQFHWHQTIYQSIQNDYLAATKSD